MYVRFDTRERDYLRCRTEKFGSVGVSDFISGQSGPKFGAGTFQEISEKGL